MRASNRKRDRFHSLGARLAARKPRHTFRQPCSCIAAGLDAIHAGVAELVDALDLGSSDESCGGSSPSARTKRFQRLPDEFGRTFFPIGMLVRRTTGAG